ncbi:hypothetical protein [Zavarzinella formosa]|uniref:hypothetical protein n=1 Tax=Zavarzinella formosa TaxID=360055 RepID=UPI0002E71B6B|nr:hypothetical protein [Zavarzinella formosa]
MNEDDIILNGINGATGEYLVAPITPSDAVKIASGRPTDSAIGSWFKAIASVFKRPKLGLPMDVDPTNPGRAGWAIVLPAGCSQELKSAVQPLIERRKNVVPPDRCKVFEYRPGETMRKWLARHGVAPGSVVPTKVPYYVTLVGGPTEIPFDFQYLLDVEYAVGRLAFDTPEQYRLYAESVAAYETATSIKNAKEVTYWGPRHPADRSTQMSADSLIRPLMEGMPAAGDQAGEAPIATEKGFRSKCFLAADSTKARLLETLHPTTGTAPPAVLFTASHGMGWPKDDPRQLTAQGALLAQDWAGFGQVSPAHYLTAPEVEAGANVSGLVAFLFACYGAGTPATDAFLTERGRGPTDIASAPFVGALPQRLLSHPNGSALAVVGHVERAWGYSIRPTGAGSQIGPFRDFLARVLSGEPVGHATKNFSERYAVLSTALASALDESSKEAKVSPQEIAAMWVERNDAQNYVVLGDPAVKLRTDLLT